MTFCFVAELPRRRGKSVFGPITASSQIEAFDRLWCKFPRAIAIQLYPLRVGWRGDGIATAEASTERRLSA
jgi:hypothetical protein